MAFEAFLEESKPRPRAGRWLAVSASVVGHSVLLLGLAALVLQPVVQATLPTRVAVSLRVPFRPRPPSPAPAEPRAAPAAPRPATVASAPALPRPPRRRPRPARAEVVPPAPPSAAPPAVTDPPAAAEPAGPVEAAVTQPGPVAQPSPAAPSIGASGGAGVPTAAGPPRRPRFLPESLGASQKLTGDLPRLPPALARSGDSYTVLTRVCVSETGQVSSVSIERSAHPALDSHVASTLATWRYRPLLAASLPIPFCTFVRFEFRAL